MRWSKLRKELKDRLADNLKGRLDYHLTTYKNSTGFLGRAWITYDGEEIINFSNMDTLNRFQTYSNAAAETTYISHDPIESSQRSKDKIMEIGEFSKYDFGHNALEFLNLNVFDCLKSENPILQILAVVDNRVGKRSLQKLQNTDCHPMIEFFISLRCS